MPEWNDRLESLKLNSLSDLFGCEKPVIGMVHLWPLPGSPGYTGYGIDHIINKALEDTRTLVNGGVNGLIVENMWDIPFFAGEDIPPEEMTCMAVASRAIAEESKPRNVPVGINVIHNGGMANMAIAVASGADFIRVCILTGARLWDTGELDHGCAAKLLRYRKNLQAEHIKLLADVDKKHSIPFPGLDLETHIVWTEFYMADALIVSGKMTGNAPDVEDLKKARKVAKRPILLGGGTTPENIEHLLEFSDGVIVGSGLKVDGYDPNPVDPRRVKDFMDAAKRARTKAGFAS